LHNRQLGWAFIEYQKLPIKRIAINYRKTLKLCGAYKIYAYDAAYLELSQRLGLPLLTFDDGMKEIADKMKIKLQEI
jgi:predicted nucleic acid-binding protein